jgi:hypothetical protein
MPNQASATIAPGEYRLRLPGTIRPVTLRVSRSAAGATLVYAGRRWVGCLTAAGAFEGHAWARVALATIPTHGQQVRRCLDCRRELTDPASIARGFGPDCWASRRAS